MRETRTPPSKCLSCGYQMDSAGGAYDQNAVPQANDLTNARIGLATRFLLWGQGAKRQIGP